MDNTKRNEILFDAMLKAALEQYMEEKCATYPSDEELAKLYPVPKKGLKRLKKELRRRARLKKRSPLRTVGIISIVIASVIAVFAALMLIPAVRGAVGDLTQDLFGIKIVIDSSRTDHRTPPFVSGDPLEEDELVYDYDITYIPDGYTRREVSESGNRGYYSYFDDSGRYIYISISSAKMTSVSLDKDSFDHDDVEIKGRECHFAYNEDNSYGTLIISDGDFVVQIDAIAEKQDFLKIAEGILKDSPENNSENAPPINLY